MTGRDFWPHTTMKEAEIDYLLTFEPIPEGTRMRWSGSVRPQGSLRLLTPVVGWMGRRQEQRIWRSMKRLLEHSPEKLGSTDQ